MKVALVALLALVQCSVVAGQTSSAAASQDGTELGSYSIFEVVPAVNPSSVDSNAGKQSSVGVEIFSADVLFLNPLHIESPPAHAVSEVRKALMNAFQYDPSTRDKSGIRLAENDGPVTMMKPFLVRGAREREAAEAIEAKEKSEAAELFDPTAGGRMAAGSMGYLKIELGIWKHDSRDPNSTHLGPNDLIHIMW